MAASDDALESVSNHQIDILRVEAGLRAAVIERLIELEGSLTTTLARNGDNLTANKFAKLDALLKQTTGQIIDAYSQIEGVSKNDLQQLAKLEVKQAVKIVNGTIGADVVSVALSPKQLEAIVDDPIIRGNSSKTWWESQSEDLRAKFGAAMREGLLLGESIDELARRVRGTKANGYADGIMEKKKREAEALVRSSVISTANEARLRTYKEMPDLVKGIQWVATLDGRTTPICRALDGKVWRLPDFAPVGHDKKYPGPTAHFNCRSTQIAVLRSWEELSGKKLPSIGADELQAALEKKLAARGWDTEKIAKAKANTRASMDGQEAKETTFDDWMGKKGPAAVDRLLGPGRAKLWKAGDITVSDLTNQNNRPLTLTQLANKIERGIPAPETLGQSFLPLSKKPKDARPAPEPAPDPEPELSPEDAAAKVKLSDAAGTKLNSKLVGEVLAANPDASPAVQWAIFQEKKLAKEIATSLNDDAAEKAAAGNTPAKVKTILNKLADDDPAKLAFADKVALAKIELAATKAIVDFEAKGPDHAAAVKGATSPGASKAMILADSMALLDMFGNTNLQQVASGSQKAHVVLKAKAGAMLKTKPGAGYEDWLQVQAEAKAAIAAATSGALLAGAAKNIAAGKKLSPGQQAAVDALDAALPTISE